MSARQDIRGVNLDGWLVLERWITPALFSTFGATTEAELLKKVKAQGGESLLKTHRDSFITSHDFAYLADRGFNSVRLPVPWHVFGDASSFSSAYDNLIGYVDQCFDMAKAFNMSVLIDLHSAPGGQNDKAYATRHESPEWHLNESNRINTLAVLGLLAERYKDHPALFGIELLNAPQVRKRYGLKVTDGIPMHYLRNFYRAGYQIVRKYLDADKAVVLHDANSPGAWASFMSNKEYENVWLDLHRFHCDGKDDTTLHKGIKLHDAMKADRKAIARAHKGNKKVLIGEWSAGLSIPISEMTPEGRSAFERVFVKRQLKEFEKADGWYFMNYKCEGRVSGWDSRKALSFLEREMLI